MLDDQFTVNMRGAENKMMKTGGIGACDDNTMLLLLVIMLRMSPHCSEASQETGSL